MISGCRHKAAVLCSLILFCSLGFGAWEQLNSGTIANLYSVHFPEGTQVGYAVGEVPESLVGWVVVKTTDGGANWVSQFIETTHSLNSVYFKDNNNGFAVGYAGKAVRTTDGGMTWTAMTVPCTDNLTRVQFPENDQIGYIGVYPESGAQVLKTTDGGDNWASISVGWAMNTSYSCGMATDDTGVVVGKDGFIVATADGFGTTQYEGPQTVANLTAVAFSHTDPSKCFLIGNDSVQGVIRYTETGGGPLWDSVTCPVVSALYGVDMATSDIAYFCGTDGFIGRTISHTYVRRTDAPSGVTVTLHGLCFPNGADTGFVVGAQGVILRTYNGGEYGGIADAGTHAARRAGIRVVANPSRHGIAFRSDAEVSITVFDAAGRVVRNSAAAKGMNFLLLSKAGTYFVKADAQTIRVVLTE